MRIKITPEAAYEKAIDKNVFINMLDEVASDGINEDAVMLTLAII